MNAVVHQARAVWTVGNQFYTEPQILLAERLKKAQHYLRISGRGLKVWDAYRPPSAQAALWQRFPNSDFVADPSGDALHTWGVAVDATLVLAFGFLA